MAPASRPNFSTLPLAALRAWEAALTAAIAAAEASGGGWTSSPMTTGSPSSCSSRSLWRAKIMNYLDDILGAVALFLLLVAGFWVAQGAGLPTGGDELLQVVK